MNTKQAADIAMNEYKSKSDLILAEQTLMRAGMKALAGKCTEKIIKIYKSQEKGA